jgi:RimJ/RimL family protein N-acetyltransferase
MRRLADIVGGRLILRLMSPEALRATAECDVDAVSKLTGLKIPPDWSEVAPLAERRLKQIDADPRYLPWSIRAIVLRDTEDVAGYINFHAPAGSQDLKPHGPGAVELGYTVIARHRRRGIASEAVRMVIAWAKERGADAFVFSISPVNIASLALARRLGAVKVGSHVDEEDGPEDVYLLKS